METTGKKYPAIEPESLIGTKWAGYRTTVGSNEKLEFIDEKSCIYTVKNQARQTTYTVSGNKLFLGDREEPFELVYEIFYFKGLPHFEKEESTGAVWKVI